MVQKKTTVLLLGLLFLFFLLLFVFKFEGEMADFEVNYAAGKRLSLGETLYRSEDGHFQFKYSPFSAFLYLPLSSLPLPYAKFIWYVLSLSASGAIFIISLRMQDNRRKYPAALAVLPPLILAKYFLREVQLGQINALITFLLLLVAWVLSRPTSETSRLQEGAAGLLWGLATALKPYAVIFLPYLVLKKKWRVFVPGFLILGLSFLMPSLYYGFKGNITVHTEWRASLSLSTPPLLDSQDNVSLMGLLVKWTGAPDVSLVLFLGVVVFLSFLFLYLIHKGQNRLRPYLLESFFLLSLIPLLSPLGWDYTFLSSAPAVILLLRHFDDFPRTGKAFLALDFIVIAFSLYDVMGRTLYAAFMSASLPTLCFIILIGYISYLRIKGHA